MKCKNIVCSKEGYKKRRYIKCLFELQVSKPKHNKIL